jgi:hypothetical protein
VDGFSDDQAGLGESFKGLAAEFALFAPFASRADGLDYSTLLGEALEMLVEKGRLAREPGRHVLTEAERIACISNKRCVFGGADIGQLEAAGRYFAERQTANA